MKSIALVVALLVLTAGAAHAFTYETTGSAGGLDLNGKSKFIDPDDSLTDSPKSSKSSSGFHMSFGSSQNQPGQFGAQNLFLQSRNRAFASPFQQPNPFAGQN